MSGKAAINLATVGTAELEAMSVQVFTGALESMSGEAIARFRSMRKLSTHHRQALEKYLVEHPEKRGEGEAPPAPAASGSAKPVKAAKPVKPAGTPSGTPKRSPFPEFKRRLRAWWEGVDVKDLSRLEATRGKGKPEDKAAPPAPKHEPASHPAPEPAVAAPMPLEERTSVIQKIWGEGFSLPGGEDFFLNLVKGAKLAPNLPCLDLTPGLGGGMRAIARKLNVTVEGLERDPIFAMAGGMISDRLGMTQTAPIRSGNPESEPLTDGGYAAIFAREAFFTSGDRKRLLAMLAKALTDGGSLIFTDFILTDRLNKDETLTAWRAAERRKPLPATREDYSELLQELRYQVKVCDDLSTQYIHLIQAGWKQLHSCLQTAKLPPETAEMLMEEGNLWLARSRALESGHLRLLHVHAVMHRAPKRALSDSMKIE